MLMSVLLQHAMQHLLYVQILLGDSFVNARMDLNLILVHIYILYVYEKLFYAYCKFHCLNFLIFALDCRPVGDLGLSSGIIPDTSIKVSGAEASYGKNVRF